jgi:hypothetical protein
MPDLATYKPESVDELLGDLLEVAAAEAAKTWKNIQADITDHLQFIAKMGIKTSAALLDKTITQREADHTFMLLRLNLNSALLHADILPYAVGQNVLNGVFGVLRAAVRNLTGIDLNF